MRLVSLGQACETAFQIRMHTPKVDADFFDWLITPFDGLMMALRSDFSNLLEADDLYLQDDRNFVNSYRTGIQYGHVFLRDETHLHPDDFINDLPRVTSIFQHLKSKFIANASAGGSLGFVRRNCTREQAETLTAFFRERYPTLVFKIIAVNAISEGVAEIDADRYMELIVPESGPDGLGHMEEWAAALLASGLTEKTFVKTKADVFNRLMVHMVGDVNTLVGEMEPSLKPGG